VLTAAEKKKSVTCPMCRAGVGERCLDLRSGHRGLRMMGFHEARATKAKEAFAQAE
jgi:hypothetical protein